MAEIMVIGAGKTGRGFVGRLLADAGRTCAFVDKNDDLVKALAEDGAFTIHFFGEVREPKKVDGFTATGWDRADFSDTKLILVSVGGSNLADVGAALHDRIPGDREIYIITCENASDPAGTLAAAVDLPNVTVSQSTVFCTTTSDIPEGKEASFGRLDINSENYPYLQFDADRLNGFDPEIPTLKPIKNFGNFLTRKLFTYNAASGIIAYMGYLYGYKDYGQAANSPLVQALLDNNYSVSNKVLCEAFGYDPEDQEEFAKLSRDKFTSTVIKDTVERNAREPQRKLGPKERIIGPMKLMKEYGKTPKVLMMTAAAALLYDGPGEEKWNQIQAENTPEEILVKIGGLDADKDKDLIDGIMEYYREYKAGLGRE